MCSNFYQFFLSPIISSPSGKLVQIEYALAAVAAGGPSVGIKGKVTYQHQLHKMSFECCHCIIQYSKSPLYRHLLNTNTRVYQRLCLFWQKAQMFSLTLTCSLQTSVNMDNGTFLGPELQTLIYHLTPFYRHWLPAHCVFHCYDKIYYVLIADIVLS